VRFHAAALPAPVEADDAGVERPARFVVMAMGKLGGEELNFASDIDILYVYSSTTAALARARSTSISTASPGA